MWRVSFALALAGCVATRTPLFVAAPPREDPPVDALLDQAAQAFAAREDPRALDRAIALLRDASAQNPSDPAILVRLSQAARLRAESLDGRAGAKLADEAVGFAERALATNAELRALVQARREPDVVFAAATERDLPALVAYCEALFSWSDRAGTQTVMQQQRWIQASCTRAITFDRAAGYGAADRVLASLDAALPVGDGANFVDAMERFEASIAEAPGYLPTRVAYAERLAARLREETLYHRLLDEAANADPNALPAAAPENRIAQRRARALLERELRASN